jgi:hypothetical protein
LTLKVAAFIPDEWVGNPWWLTRLFAGDNRDFSPYDGTSKIQTIMDVLNPAVNDDNVLSGPYNTSVLTLEFDKDSSLTFPPFGNITQSAREDWCWEDCDGTAPLMKTRWAFGDTSGTTCGTPQRQGPSGNTSSHRVHCSAWAPIPFSPAPGVNAPPIRWELDFTFRYGQNRVQYTVTGCTGYFPAYEAYANGRPLLLSTRSATPEDLFYGCAEEVSEQGEIQ